MVGCWTILSCVCVCHARGVAGGLLQVSYRFGRRIACHLDRRNKHLQKSLPFAGGCDPLKGSNGPILTEIRSKRVVKFTAFIRGSPSFCIAIASPYSVELMCRKNGETRIVDAVWGGGGGLTAVVDMSLGACSPSPAVSVHLGTYQTSLKMTFQCHVRFMGKSECTFLCFVIFQTIP